MFYFNLLFLLFSLNKKYVGSEEGQAIFEEIDFSKAT